jgi:hypothetical protein
MLVILFGATGGVGSMLIRGLASHPGLTLVSCGRRRPEAPVKHYEWSFGSRPPIERILREHGADPVTVVYAPIAWPSDQDAVDANLAALAVVAAAVPAEGLFISISSLVVNTRASTFYAALKRRAEEICTARGGINLRLGMIDSERPFGQSLMFVKLARAFHIVPVPFPKSRVVLSEENDIVCAVAGLMGRLERPANHIAEVRSASASFIEAVRRIVRRQNVRCLCVPVPDAISLGTLLLCRRIAPRSWLSQRLQGLQSFSAG